MTHVIASGEMPVADFWFRKDELPSQDGRFCVYFIFGQPRKVTDDPFDHVHFYVGCSGDLRNRINAHKRWMEKLHAAYVLSVSWLTYSTQREALEEELAWQQELLGTRGCQETLRKYGVREFQGRQGLHKAPISP